MASAQVLPSSRKQEHLEAGKRRLEEFRKKKAAERAKKAAATSQPLSSDVTVDKKQALEAEHVRLTDSDGAGTSNGPSRTFERYDEMVSNGSNTTNVTTKPEEKFLKDPEGNPPSASDYNSPLADRTTQRPATSHDFKRLDTSRFSGAAGFYRGQEMHEKVNDSSTYVGSESGVLRGAFSEHSTGPIRLESQHFGGSYNLYVPLQSTENNVFLKDSAFYPPQVSGKSNISYANTLATGVDFIEPNINLRGSNSDVGQGMHGLKRFNGSLNSDFGERNFSGSTGGSYGVNFSGSTSGSYGVNFSGSTGSSYGVYGNDVQTSESIGLNSDVRSSPNQVQLFSGASEPSSRRSRPSFIDSLNVIRASSGTLIQSTEPPKESYVSGTLKSNGMDSTQSSHLHNPSVLTDTLEHHSTKFSVSPSNGVDLMMSNVDENNLDRKHDIYSSKQNEDFSALEQHIEDLTQEKFSLQRALEASRTLAESLASENSSLTDNYNQQRSVVNQLKSDMEKLQGEIQAHLMELESVKMEYANAKLECTAADERGKILASEVIGLEEKALRLRSNELKLERQLENSHAEIASYKKKMSSLEKDRQDLQTTIDALQEEKKLLQSKLRKASASGKSIDVGQIPINKRDMSTSTDDLEAMPGTSNQEVDDTSVTGSEPSGFSGLPENEQSNLEVSSVHIPSDHTRMIENINTLISELALEKEELIQALASESSQSARLKEINNELSRKLEAQTQRLELLTAKSMAIENAPSRLPDSRVAQETPTYADEGDEVVERVLGWIMKLFPGGPSKRRTSKLL